MTPSERARGTARPVGRLAPDAVALVVLLGLAVVGSWDLLRPGGVTVGLDAVSFFYPMYGFLGERLRDGDIPGWNPAQFAGAPFAADPESGWMYLPAMVAFAILPMAAAAKAFALVHLVLAGVGTYLLARLLRIGPVGALTAAVAFAGGGFFSDRLRCCFAHVQVAAWLPWLLVGTELGVRSRGWGRRGSAWGLAGLALSQILAGWLGQGAAYALLAFGVWLAYRVAIDPAGRPASIRRRVRALPFHGGAILGIGFGLAAAGVLPRLAYHACSNLADGYGGDPNLAWAADPGGWPWRDAAEVFLEPRGWYVGGAVVALAVLAPFVAGRRHAVPLLGALAVSALVLASDWETPLHALLYRLPAFEDLHRHRPERVLLVWYLATALLAGATVAAVPRWYGGQRRRVVALALVPLGLVGWFALRGVPVSVRTWGVLILASVAIGAVAAGSPAVGVAGRALVVLVVAADLGFAARSNVAQGLFATVDLARWSAPSGAAAFLRRPSDEGEPAFRFFGYDPSLATTLGGQTTLYRHNYRDPRSRALLVNNRATLLGLRDVQGYNPIQPRRYVEFLTALNGHPQEYHGAYVFADGLGSSLLDLLGARFVVLPDPIPPDRADLERLVAEHPTVFREEGARVVERAGALARGWIVHDARRVEAGGALPLLVSGAVDPRRTALLEVDPPSLAAAGDGSADRVETVAAEADRLRLRTRSDAAGLLVLSETYDPGWSAEVDGAPAPVLVADHILRAVPVPAGEHEVVLRYDPPELRVGLAISIGTVVLLAAVPCLALLSHARRRRRTFGCVRDAGPVAGRPVR